jgi:nicotinamidase-related amidase
LNTDAAVTEAKLASDVVTDSSTAFELDAERTALVVIDMQYASACRTTGLGRWLDELGVPPEQASYRFDRLEQLAVPTLAKLVEAFRANGRPVVYVVLGSSMPGCADLAPQLREVEDLIGNYVGSKEFEILEELQPREGEPVVRKLSASAFTSSNLDTVLRNLGAEQIVVGGLSTSHCVDLTARDAADHGYEVVIVEDAVTDDRPELHEMTLTVFRTLFGRVASADEVLGELFAGVVR